MVRRVTLAAAVVLVAGCGSGGAGFVPAAAVNGPDQNAVRAVIVSYAHALALGDGVTLCSLLDEAAQQQLAQRSGAGALTATTPPAAICAQTVAQTWTQLTDAQRTALSAVVVKGVVVEGDVATVNDSELTAPGAAPSGPSGGSIVLVRQGARWLISQIG